MTTVTLGMVHLGLGLSVDLVGIVLGPEFGNVDPPPLNWSDLIVRIMKEDRYGEEDIQARGDCFEAASG